MAGMVLPVVSVWAALMGLWMLVLTVLVIRHRRRAGVGLGDGGDPALARAIRVHGNAVENVPFQILLLALLELAGIPAPVLHGLGAAILVSRLLHASGLGRRSGRSPGRFWGMALSLLLSLLMPLLLLARVLAWI